MVTCTLWDDSVANLMHQLPKTLTDGTVIISLENFRIVEQRATDWSGTMITTIRKIESFGSKQQSLPGTCIQVIREASSPYLRNSQPLPEFPESICITRFAPHVDAHPAPFTCTIRGTIVAVAEMDHTRNATSPQLKLCFELMDNEGTWIRCCATGENARKPCLQPGVEVIMFCCTALEPLGNSIVGMLYVTKDSTIVPVAQTTALKYKQLEWTIQGKPSTYSP